MHLSNKGVGDIFRNARPTNFTNFTNFRDELQGRRKLNPAQVAEKRCQWPRKGVRDNSPNISA